jgi:hypothetical protein
MNAEDDRPLVHDVPEDRVQDPREDDEWFRRLPERAKQEMRGRWRTQDLQGAQIRELRKVSTWRYVAQGAALLLIIETVFAPSSWARTGAALLAGAALGFACALVRAGRDGFVALGIPCYLGMRFVFGFGSYLYEFFVALLFISLCAIIGFSHESRRWDASEI